MESGLEKVSELSGQYQYTGKSGVDEREEILIGCPHGGVATRYPDRFGQLIVITTVRCAINMKINGDNNLIASMYIIYAVR